MTQNTRSPASLQPGWLQIDDRTPRQLLAQTLPTAGLFNYVNRFGQRDGTWSVFFDREPLVRYARLAELDVVQYERLFRNWIETLRDPQLARGAPQWQAACWSAIEGLQTIFALVDEEATIFKTLPGEQAFAQALAGAITSPLAHDWAVMRGCRAWLERHAADVALPRPSSLRHTAWNVEIEDLTQEGDLIDRLAGAATSTRGVCVKLAEEAQANFGRRYDAPRLLAPHFAVYLAFVRQFVRAQEALNRIPHRHLKHFYCDTLKLERKPPRPDRTFVAFEPAGPDDCDLPAGTALRAGKDAAGGTETYRTTAPLTVIGGTQLRFAAICLGEPSQAGGGNFYAGPLGDSAEASWSPFGLTPDGGAAGWQIPAAEAGFAVSSPMLHLEGGNRTITITLAYRETPPAKPGAASGPVAKPTGQFEFSPDWRIDYSSTQGWAAASPTVARVTATLVSRLRTDFANAAPDTLALQVVLLSAAPPCVNHNAKISGEAYDERTPVLRVRIGNPLAVFDRIGDPGRLALRDLFLRATLDRITIDVAVEGLPPQLLRSPAGNLAPGIPAPAFGSNPAPGARLAIGSTEIFRKPLRSLALSVDWHALPPRDRHPLGLSSYFAGYLDPAAQKTSLLFQNDQYRVGISVLTGAAWKDLTTNHDFLFAWEHQDTSPTGPLLPRTTWRLSSPVVTGQMSTGIAWPAPVGDFSGAVDTESFGVTGYLAVTLARPGYTFGQQLYVTAVTEVALDNARLLAASPAPANGGKGRPPKVIDERTAYRILRTPVSPSWFRGLWLRLRHRGKPVYTFTDRLFNETGRMGALPAELARVAAQANVATNFVAREIDKLADATFSDLESLRKLIARRLEVELSSEPGAALVKELLIALAGLLLPSRPPPRASRPLPQPPLVPLISGAAIDYEAGVTFDLTDQEHQFWHIAPLATHRVSRAASPLPFVPPGGGFHVGIAGADPGSVLTLLVVVEDTRAAEGAGDAPKWACRRGETWDEELGGRVVHDGTHGLARTGLLRLDIQDTYSPAGAAMPAGFAWFRAQVDNPRNRPQIERILPHAVEAEWSMPPDLSPAALAAHFSRGTPPGTITGLVAPHAAITQVVQPVAARGGFAGEDEGAFVNRVSERLRHKGRAVTPRDYERILLEQHPEVFYARAIPPEKAGEANKIVVLVVPVARSPVARLPFFSAGELGAMADELKAAASPLVDLQVVNPIYEEIDLRIGVAFRQDRSHRYYAAKLITELRHFVSPWLYRQSEPSDPGRKFHPAEFAALIQRLDWVECLAQCLVSRNGTEEHGEFGPSDRRKLCVLGEKIAIGLPNP